MDVCLVVLFRKCGRHRIYTILASPVDGSFTSERHARVLAVRIRYSESCQYARGRQHWGPTSRSIHSPAYPVDYN